jgi:hypothetical protein
VVAGAQNWIDAWTLEWQEQVCAGVEVDWSARARCWTKKWPLTGLTTVAVPTVAKSAYREG